MRMLASKSRTSSAFRPEAGLKKQRKKLNARNQLDALAQDIQRAALLQRLLKLLEELGLGRWFE